MPNPKRRILAIDPGTKAIGVACFDGDTLKDYAVRPIKQGRTSLELLSDVEDLVDQLLREKRPDTVVLEKNAFSQIRQNALLTLAVYKMKAVARRRGIPVRELAPNTVRKVVCGNGHATKRDTAKILVGSYPELKVFMNPGHRWKQRFFMNIFDAIALGLAFLQMTEGRHGNT